MNRRHFIKSIALSATIPLFSKQVRLYQSDKFASIMYKSIQQKWYLVPIEDIIARIGIEMIGIPYVSGTLDVNEEENIVVNFTGLDCVTFFENSLAMARCIKKQKYDISDMRAQIRYIRYRGGAITDYSSRLHYTSEWILDNIKKQVVQDITPQLGGILHQFAYDWISSHPQNYPMLKNNSDMVSRIKKIEESLNDQPMFIIPTEEITKNVKQINDGDIIAIAINTTGLDYGHVGIAFNSGFMHASSKEKKVIISNSLTKFVKEYKNSIGISVVRAM